MPGGSDRDERRRLFGRRPAGDDIPDAVLDAEFEEAVHRFRGSRGLASGGPPRDIWAGADGGEAELRRRIETLQAELERLSAEAVAERQRADELAEQLAVAQRRNAQLWARVTDGSARGSSADDEANAS